MQGGSYSGKEVRDPTGQEPGRFRATTSGTAAAPIVLTGSSKAVIDGGGTGGGYALHLKGANYWKLQGFTVRESSKGIVLDGSSHNVIDSKGTGYQIDANHGMTAARPTTTECCDGVQVHVILDGWGQNNVISANSLEVNAPGAGIWLQNAAVALGNVIRCDNRVAGATPEPYATNQ